MKTTSPELAAVPSATASMPRVTSIVLAFWAGSLWAICGMVAPTLFAMLDRAQAGRLAARFFDLITAIGVIAALILLLPTLGRYVMPGRYTRTLVLLTAGLPLLSKLVIAPLMAQARAAADMVGYGRLHGVAAGLFMLACASALGVVWNFSQRGK